MDRRHGSGGPAPAGRRAMGLVAGALILGALAALASTNAGLLRGAALGALMLLAAAILAVRDDSRRERTQARVDLSHHRAQATAGLAAVVARLDAAEFSAAMARRDVVALQAENARLLDAASQARAEARLWQDEAERLRREAAATSTTGPSPQGGGDQAAPAEPVGLVAPGPTHAPREPGDAEPIRTVRIVGSFSLRGLASFPRPAGMPDPGVDVVILPTDESATDEPAPDDAVIDLRAAAERRLRRGA